MLEHFALLRHIGRPSNGHYLRLRRPIVKRHRFARADCPRVGDIGQILASTDTRFARSDRHIHRLLAGGKQLAAQEQHPRINRLLFLWRRHGDFESRRKPRDRLLNHDRRVGPGRVVPAGNLRVSIENLLGRLVSPPKAVRVRYDQTILAQRVRVGCRDGDVVFPRSQVGQSLLVVLDDACQFDCGKRFAEREADVVAVRPADCVRKVCQLDGLPAFQIR